MDSESSQVIQCYVSQSSLMTFSEHETGSGTAKLVADKRNNNKITEVLFISISYFKHKL